MFIKNWISGNNNFEIQTSGSTGTPKKIMLERSKMEISAEMTANFFNLRQNDTILINLNTFMIAGIMMLVRALHLNMKYKIVEPSSNPLEKINESYDFYAFVPLQLQNIIESNKSNLLHKAKGIIVGGAPLTLFQENLFQKLNLPLYLTYGMTETCSHIALKHVNDSHYHALENVFFDINEHNCLIINSPTAVCNPLITNDVVELISNKEFIWKGRFDNVINSGGIKLQVEEIEKKIEQVFINQNFNFRFFIASVPDVFFNEKMILVVESDDIINIDFSFLPKYHQPKEIVCIPQFLETKSGKINRKETLNQLLKK